ncbi:MAG: hypothetical protein KQH83_11795 [Actinobacteria bacterium]|nr:hypothetical protein [Actinomycetota bacterium]
MSARHPALDAPLGRFRAALAAAGGFDAGRFDRPGTLVVPQASREGTRVVSVHAFGAAAVAWCDPGLADAAAALASETETFDPAGLAAWAAPRGGEFVGGAWSHLTAPSLLAGPPEPDGCTVAPLDRDDPGDRGRIAALVEACGEDDAEEAEIHLDDLDPLILGVAEPGGTLAGLAGERPWDLDAGTADIAVLTRPDARGRGVGGAAVAAVCREDFRLGRLPLYRCNWDNAPSRALALSLGFVEVLSLAAVRFP